MRAAIGAVFGLLLLAACADDSIKSTDIVSSVPWPEQENALYRILDDDDEEVGVLRMAVGPQDDDAYLMSQLFTFPDDGFTNDAEVVVSRDELRPRRTAYTIDGPDGIASCTAEYEAGKVTVDNIREDGERTDTLDVPVVAYDSWSDLFVWRTINFTQGFEVEYADIIACQAPAPPQRLGVKLRVTGGETIEVPAGTFDTWRMEIEGGRDQKAWFTTDGAHVLVRYDNGEQVFELVDYSSSEGGLSSRIAMGVGFGIGVESPPTSAMHSTKMTNASSTASTSQPMRTIPSFTARLSEVDSYERS